MFIRLMSRFAPLVILTALSAPTTANAQDRPTITASIEDLGPRFTSNAFLSEKHAQSDVFTSPTFKLKAKGLLAPGLAYSFSAAMVNARYRRFSGLDEDLVALTSGVSYTSGPWTLTAQYSPKWVYTREFDALSAELHDFTGIVEGRFKWNNVEGSPMR